eukprot:1920836-Rhodomonas_salina.1
MDQLLHGAAMGEDLKRLGNVLRQRVVHVEPCAENRKHVSFPEPKRVRLCPKRKKRPKRQGRFSRQLRDSRHCRVRHAAATVSKLFQSCFKAVSCNTRCVSETV